MAKNPSVAPAAASIQENSRGKLDLQTSSASFLVTMAGVVHPMKAVRFFSAWFQLRVILQQYLSNDSLHWCLQVHWDFSIFLSEGQQQNVVNSLPNIFVHESCMFQWSSQMSRVDLKVHAHEHLCLWDLLHHRWCSWGLPSQEKADLSVDSITWMMELRRMTLKPNLRRTRIKFSTTEMFTSIGQVGIPVSSTAAVLRLL